MNYLKNRINEAMELGKKNQEIIDLAQNFCKHLQVEKPMWSGTGIPEMLTGLPIGPRTFRCQYARARGLGSMNLEGIALDYYDRNCFDCTKREVIRLPNLLALVDERAKRKAEEAKREAETAEKYKAIEISRIESLKKRKETRLSLRTDDGARNSILDLIDEVDSSAKDSDKKLIEIAKIALYKFDKHIHEALFELIETGDFSKTECAIETLTIIANNGQSIKRTGKITIMQSQEDQSVDIDRLVLASLKALSDGGGHNEAATVIDYWLDIKHREHINPKAIKKLIHLAFPSSSGISFSVTVYRPGPLLKVYDVAPDKVLETIKNMLTANEKWIRIAAAGASEYIIEKDNNFGIQIARPILDSLVLPDDAYDGGSAQQAATHTLGRALIYKTEAMDRILQEAITNADSDLKGEIFSSYDAMFDEDRRGKKSIASDEAKKVATKRILEVLIAKPNDDRLEKANHIFDRFQYGNIKCLVGFEDLLIGAAAAISEELDNPYSMITDPSPSPVKVMEASTRSIKLNGVLNSIERNLGYLCRLEPDSAGKKVIDCIKNLGEKNETLKATLIVSIGYASSNPKMFSLALPTISGGFVDKSSLVRASAVQAYGELIKNNLENVPSSLHEFFCFSLNDPYVYVHKHAVQILSNVKIRKEDIPIVRNRLIILILSYQGGKSDADFLYRCIDELLSLYDRFSPVDKPLTQLVLKLLPLIRPYNRVDIFRFHNGQLKDVDGYADSLTSLLLEKDIYDLNLDEVIEIMKKLPISEIIKARVNLETGTKNLISTHRFGTSLEIIELLSRGRCLQSTVDLTQYFVDAIEDNTENRPLRLNALSYNIAARLEMAISNGNMGDIDKYCNLWVENMGKIKEDNEKNAERRNFFRGV